MTYFLIAIMLCFSALSMATEHVVWDSNRQRPIPYELTPPMDSSACSATSLCPVALLSAGYGVHHTHYRSLASLLSKHGFLVITIGHELDGDPPLAISGDLFKTRAENWQRGAQSLRVIRAHFQANFTQYNFNDMTLIGHSNGGDISAWLSRKTPHWVSRLITLDHRRVPLPTTKEIKVLSIRASDFDADKGVLPSQTMQTSFGSCVVTIPDSRHNDMSDSGPNWLKRKIKLIIDNWLSGITCTHLSPTS